MKATDHARTIALDMAVRAGIQPEANEVTVTRAKAFYEFLNGTKAKPAAKTKRR